MIFVSSNASEVKASSWALNELMQFPLEREQNEVNRLKQGCLCELISPWETCIKAFVIGSLNSKRKLKQVGEDITSEEKPICLGIIILSNYLCSLRQIYTFIYFIIN